MQPVLRNIETNQTSGSVHLLSECLDYTQSKDSYFTFKTILKFSEQNFISYRKTF